ncbi:hypothetical protein [Paenibacillus sp. HB172176]|uniref:hypothetical protein n=1 Tax=Paenibacillus sp. HB172176 TaxID=2493690 RepID=UPI00143B4C3D|nr:hypothetical protein [Paenibacillus sp. HB172176]
MQIGKSTYLILSAVFFLLLFNGCGTELKSTNSSHNAQAAPNQIEEHLDPSAGDADFEETYAEQEKAATGWTESELKALAEMPPNDYDPTKLSAEQQKIFEEEQAENHERLKDIKLYMYTDLKTGEKYWEGASFADMGALLSYAVHDTSMSGGYIRFPGDDRFLTEMTNFDPDFLAIDAMKAATTAFEHLPTVNHMDISIYQNTLSNLEKQQPGTLYGEFTINREDYEAVKQDTALTDEQRFKRIFIVDDFSAR